MWLMEGDKIMGKFQIIITSYFNNVVWIRQNPIVNKVNEPFWCDEHGYKFEKQINFDFQ